MVFDNVVSRRSSSVGLFSRYIFYVLPLVVWSRRNASGSLENRSFVVRRVSSVAVTPPSDDGNIVVVFVVVRVVIIRYYWRLLYPTTCTAVRRPTICSNGEIGRPVQRRISLLPASRSIIAAKGQSVNVMTYLRNNSSVMSVTYWVITV